MGMTASAPMPKAARPIHSSAPDSCSPRAAAGAAALLLLGSRDGLGRACLEWVLREDVSYRGVYRGLPVRKMLLLELTDHHAFPHHLHLPGVHHVHVERAFRVVHGVDLVAH